MFMQIAIRREDQPALRFLWPNEEMINKYQFTRLIFGATCSPCCAVFVLNRCAEDNEIEFPKAVNAIKNHFYMDDYIQSLPSIEEAIETINQTKDSLHKGGFRLTKFVSNKHEALRFIEQEDRDELKEINRVLGQKWNTRTDCFLMKTLEQFPRNASEYTQTKLFSLVSTIFDPLGILSPLTIRIKMLLQQVWKLGKKWDEPLPVELHSNLQKVLDSYFAMPDIKIPRWLNSSTNKENNHQLHISVDASTVALSAVAYIRTQKPDEIFQTSFLLKKCKFAAIKQISVPKLELEAAVLGSRLRTLIETEMTLKFEKVYLWTDSVTNQANQLVKQQCELGSNNNASASSKSQKSRYGQSFANKNQNQFPRAILNNANESFSVNHLQSTPKEWFEQLQLIPVSFLNGKKAFDTYALIDPGSQFTFILDKITEFLALPCEDQEATTLQYLNTEHDMPLSKISEQVTVAPYENLDQKFQIKTT